METLPLRLQDLSPKKTTFTLDDFPGEKFTLCRWSLRVRMWVFEKYTTEKVKEIFEKQLINDIAVIAYYMLEEKNKFPTLESFLDSIASIQDQINLTMAMLGAVGIGEPEIQKITEAMEKKENPESPNEVSPNP